MSKFLLEVDSWLSHHYDNNHIARLLRSSPANRALFASKDWEVNPRYRQFGNGGMSEGDWVSGMGRSRIRFVPYLQRKVK